MPVSNAKHTYTTILARNGNTIAEVKSISGPEMSLNAIDVTHLNSPDAFKEFVGGMRDGGEVSIEGNFYPGDTNGQKGLHDDLVAATMQTFVLTFPTAMATTWTFTALVTKFKTEAPLDDKVPFSASMKISGKPVLAITLSTGMSGWAGIEENAGAALVEVPGFAIGTFEYSCTVNTLSTWVKMTPTAAAHTITIHDYFDDSYQTVASGNQSGALDIGAADTVTQIDVTVQETGKVAKTYVFYIVRP